MIDEPIVRWSPAAGPPRRLRFRSRDDGWWRCEEIWTGCAWRETGREPICELSISD